MIVKSLVLPFSVRSFCEVKNIYLQLILMQIYHKKRKFLSGEQDDLFTHYINKKVLPQIFSLWTICILLSAVNFVTNCPIKHVYPKYHRSLLTVLLIIAL